MDAQKPRERYRAQVCSEIKEHAWEQIADAGVPALSLNAIAKKMGMSGPALYRYYGSRDELITELVRDAYRSLADTLRETVDSGGDVTALGYATRTWALADPQRYFLVYGTPVPGYHAPDEITAIADEIVTSILDAYSALPSDEPVTAFVTHLDDHSDWATDHSASSTTRRRALAFWTRLHGILSLELAGHFTGMGFDPAFLFADELIDLVAGEPDTTLARCCH